MKVIRGNMDKIFAVSAYSRALGGDFTGRPRLSVSVRDVNSHLLQVDAALRGMLSSLHVMRDICVSCFSGQLSETELDARNSELAALKEDIARLSKSIAGMEFLMFSAPDGRVADISSIDNSINKVSGLCETIPDAENDEKLAAWMMQLLRKR
jgi:hypothetical protein